MVAVVTGNGLGLEGTSGWVLGSRGQLGQAALGRANDNVYVNAATGNLVIQNTDEVLVGRGPDAILARTYNSQGLFTDDNGDNWRPSVSRKVAGLTGTVNTAGSTVTRTDWDGSEVVYAWDAARSAYVSKEGAGAYDTLTFAGTTWTWKDGNSRVTELYDSANGGRITSSADTDGNALTFAYGSNGLVSRVTTADGYYTDLVYSGAQLTQLTTTYLDFLTGVVQSITRVQYGYDGSGRLSSVTTDLTPNNTADTVTYVTTYTYDGTSKRVASIAQTDGSLLSIGYTLVGSDYRVSSLTQAVSGGVARTTTIAYDTTTRTTSITDPAGQVTALVYDTAGQLTQITMPAAVSGGTAQVVQFTYNANGDVLTVDSGGGATTTYTYDGNGNVLSEHRRLAQANADETLVINRTYGANNELLTETRYTATDLDGTGASVPSGAMTTRYAYDGENHLRFMVTAEGRVTQYEYAGVGYRAVDTEYTASTYDVSGLTAAQSISESALNTWATTVADKTQVMVTSRTFDFRGNVYTVRKWASYLSDGSGDSTVRAEYIYDFHWHDQTGNLIQSRSSGYNSSETYVYDGLNRLVSSVDHLGLSTTIQFNDTSSTTVVTVGGTTRTSVYNLAGELISETEAGGALTATTDYAYDDLGRLRRVTDATGVSTHYLYDFVGRKVAEVDADGSLVEYRYNAADLLVSTVRYKNTLSAAQMTLLVGNPTTVQLSSVRPTADNVADRWEWRIYDAAHRLVETIDGLGAATIYTYDGASRLVSVTAYASNISSGLIDGYKNTPPTTKVFPYPAESSYNRVQRNFYDADGRLTGTLDGEGYLTQVVYDSAGRKTKTIGYATVTAQANRAAGTFATLLADVTATANPKDIHSWFVYDGRGFLRGTIDGEGNLTRYHYDARGYLDQEIRGLKLDPATLLATPPTLATLPATQAGTILETTAWTRDLYGQVLTQTRTLASGSETITYTYDTQRQLIKAVTSGTGVDSRTQNQRYDGRGRLIGALSGEGSAALAALGASPTQAQIDSIYAQWGTTYVYDAADRLIAKIEPDGSGSAGRKTLYYYNKDGNLTYTVNPLGEVVGYQYNVFGQRSGTTLYATRISTSGLTGGLDTGFAPTVNAADSQTTIDYNVTGTVSQSTDALNTTTTYAYNLFREMIGKTERLEDLVFRTTSYDYDRRGLLLNSTRDVGGLNLTVSAVYDAFGRAVQTTDANNKVRSTAYDRAGRVVNTTDALGLTTSFTYDGRSNVLTRTDRDGRTTTFTYDAFSRQVTMTTPEGVTTTTTTSAYGQTLGVTVATTDPSFSRTATYTYDKDGALKTAANGTLTTTNTYDKAGRLVAVLDPSGVTTTYAYDAANRVLTRIVDQGSGRLNLTTGFAYDAKGQQVQVTDAVGTVTTIGFDKNGRKTTVVVDPGAGKLNLTTTYAHDRAGRMLIVTEGAGTAAARVTAYVYDKADRLTQTKVDPSGLNLVTTYTYDANGNAVARTDAAGAITRYVYDAENRLAFTIDAEGGVTRLAYDGEGRVTTVRVYAAKVAGSTLTGWPLALTDTQVTGAVATSSADRVTRQVYDGDGRAAYEVDAEGHVTEYQYNGAGEVTKKIRYAAAYTVGDGATTASMATMIGTPVPSTAAVTTYTYDGVGRLVTTMDAEGVTTNMVYDAMGRITHLTRADNSTDYSLTRRWYDAAGRMTSETRAHGTSAATTTTYTYDGMSRVLNSTDGRGFTTTRTYDAAGRLKTVTVPLSATESATTVNDYDAVNNLVKVTDPRGNAGYFYYDKAGRLTLQVDPELYATKTEYSVGGEATKVTRYANRIVGTPAIGTPPTLNPDAAKDAVTIITRDKLDRVTGVTDAESNTETYALNAFGDRVTVTNKLGGVTTNTYDKRGLLLTESKAVSWTKADGTAQSTTIVNKYEYDGRGNRTRMIEAFGATEARTTDYVYDKLDRLIQKSGDAVQVVAQDLATVSTITPTETYVYDRRGNLIQATDAAGAKTFSFYDAADRKIGEVNALGVLSRWTYDANGNATSAKIYGEAVSLPTTPGGAPPAPVNEANYRETLYTYDRNNRLTTTKVESLRTGSYVAGSGYATTVGDVTATRTYDANGNVVKQTDGAGNSTFYYYDKIGRQIAQIDAEKYMTHYTRDAEGNVTKEQRFANLVTAAFDETTNLNDPAVLNSVKPAANAAADRVTDFEYDGNGRRITETRRNVVAWSVGATGALTQAATDAIIRYEYNGLGEVTKKTEASLDVTDYVYDNFGRQTIAKGAAFTDYQGTTGVRQLTEYAYDRLNNLTQSTVHSSATLGNTADDRVTSFTYGAGGRLASMTDAEGFTRTYGYDAAGRVLKEQYSRVKSDATSVTEASAYRYDLLGRTTFQAQASLSGSTWSFGDQTQIAYNTYGEVTAKGLNGAWQETFDYDLGGRMWRSTGGDGTVKLYVHDGAGRQTLTITAAGEDLSALTIEEALTVEVEYEVEVEEGVWEPFTDTYAVWEDHGQSRIATFSVYDKRGQNTATREPFRQLSKNTDGTFNTTEITRSRTYNAFGEVTSETSARGFVTDFTYNTMGRLIEKKSPTVDVTAENGGVSALRPTETYYYDLSGRLVGVRDANNNTNTRALLAGTGHGGNEALVATEFYADASQYKVGFDVFGDARKLTNGINQVELRDYDKMSRLITITRPTRAANTPGNMTGSPVAMVENYTYDGLGQRLTHWNSQLGSTVKDTTDYDLQGRVIQAVAMGGDTTTYNYVWDANIATTGLGTFGGWTKTTVNAANKTATEENDYFGRVVGRTDYGGYLYYYSFDAAGRTVSIDRGVEYAGTFYYQYDSDYAYFNTGTLAKVTDTSRKWEYTYTPPYFDNSITQVVDYIYSYDASGNRTDQTDLFTSYNYDYFTGQLIGTSTGTYETSSATYDALERMVHYEGNRGSANTYPVTIDYEYDANSNVRYVKGTFRDLVTFAYDTTQENWYRYDSMNRVVTTKGSLSGSRGSGTIVRGTKGADLTYDAAGQRATVINGTDSSREEYYYTEDGYLSTTKISLTPTGTAVLRAKNQRDLMGRVTKYTEYDTNGTTIIYNRDATYNNRSQVTADTTYQSRSDGKITTMNTTYDYNAETSAGSGVWTGAYQGGVVTHSHATGTTTQSGQATIYITNDTKNNYVWWDDAKQSSIVLRSIQQQSGMQTSDTTSTTTFKYKGNARLDSINVGGATPKVVTYITDWTGQVQEFWEYAAAAGNEPREMDYIFDGRRLGAISNNGNGDPDYKVAIGFHRTPSSNPYLRYGTETSFADFDQSYDAINGMEAPTASRYAVRTGDTLQSIAAAIWGDGALWYVLAEANGLTASSHLAEGMVLTIPNKIVNVHNNATTFRPYNPNMMIGEVNPQGLPPQPKPPKEKSWWQKIGDMFIKAVNIIVSVAATYFLGPVLGNIAFQGYMMLTGQQEKFSWNQVGVAALTAGVTRGVQASGVFNSVASPALNAGLTAATSSAISQGIAVATGMQEKFSWTNVAVAGVTAGVTKGVSDRLPKAGPSQGLVTRNGVIHADISGAGFGNQMASNMAGAIAGAATMSLIDGTDFGDNLMSTLPQAIGQTLGNAAAGYLQQQWEERRWGETPLGKLGSEVAGLGHAVDGVVMGAGAWAGENVLGPVGRPIVNGAIELGKDVGHGIAELGRAAGHELAELGRVEGHFAQIEDDEGRLYRAPPIIPVEVSELPPAFLRPGTFAQWGSEPGVDFAMTPNTRSAPDGRYYEKTSSNDLTLINMMDKGEAHSAMAPWDIIGPGEIAGIATVGLKGLGRVGAKGAFDTAGIPSAQGITYNGLTGAGPLGSKVANTFRSGTYTEIVTSESTTLYRVYGGSADEIGPYWTRTVPQGPTQSIIDSALDPVWGNTATSVTRIEVPPGVTIFEGVAAPQGGLVGGGNQVFVPNVDPTWIIR